MQLDLPLHFNPRPAPITTHLPKTPPPVTPEMDWEKIAKDLLIHAGQPALADRLKVRWNPLMRSTAGTAQFATALITLNPRLLLFGTDEVDRTLRHELAHLLAQIRVGRRRINPHGAEWRQACVDLGLPNESRCHHLPLPTRIIARRHFYRCQNCLGMISRVRPLKSKSACLRCCRLLNSGRYDDRFRYRKFSPPQPDPPKKNPCPSPLRLVDSKPIR